MIAAALLLKVTLTLVLALAAVRVAHRSRASVRHLWLAAGFAVILALPLASLAVPAIRVEVAMAPARTEMFSAVDPVTFEAAPSEATPSSRLANRVTAPLAAPRSLATLFVAVWIGGAAGWLAILLTGVWQVRAIRRAGLPWRDGQIVVDALARDAGFRRRVDVLLHESPRGPMTCGVWQPAIVLPVSATSWPPADVHRAVIHELEHVRRGDWLSQCLARLACAAYWFHPLVWTAHRQLALEAERACDDAVLRRSEAVEYADQLVALARSLSDARPYAAPGMANRADLAARVTAVLDTRQRRGRAGAASIGLACATTLVLVLTISPLRIVAIAAQVPAAAAQTEKFEVVSIKPCATETMPPQGPGGRGAGPSAARTSPGRAYWPCVTIDQLIQVAYATLDQPLLNSLPRQIEGGPQIVRKAPSWVYSDKFEVEAKAPGHALRMTMLGPMLRVMLEDRLQLKTHRETEERTLYSLTANRAQLKIQPTGTNACTELGGDGGHNDVAGSPVAGDTPFCGSLNMSWNGGNRVLRSTGVDLRGYTINLLSGLLGRFVIDNTGLAGRYNIPLEFAPDDNTPGGLAGLAYSRREGATPPTAPTIFKALEDLGLKLEAVKGPAEFLVVDRIERPKRGGQ